ncbi:MAG: uroporphyrinogen decarboxylase family protein, partial [Candidatus Sumerlaeota bacterium]
MRKPNFENLLAVLRCEAPERPTLFEFFTNDTIRRQVCGDDIPDGDDPLYHEKAQIRSYEKSGYDYATLTIPGFKFERGEQHRAASVSQNEGVVITDQATFDLYKWPDPKNIQYDRLDTIQKLLPDGMKMVLHSPGGTLENTIHLVGYENVCLLSLTDPDFLQEVFDTVGGLLLKYYEGAVEHPAIGAVIVNDDWGFHQQTVLPPEGMRRFVFPWHKRIVQTIHDAGKPAILHSCGNLDKVYDDLIDDIGFDGKHSYEDAIQPVEEAYEQYHDRIAILGGIDVDFLCRADLETIKKRSREMLERTADRGGYALGSGNSIPEYVPPEAYFAMISVIN